jgi:hypothetical protein
MRIYLLTFILFLTGCSTVLPVTQKFPEAPEILMEKCPQLETIEKSEIVLSEFLKVVTRNYGKYHNCSNQIESWQKWYKEQQQIFEGKSPKK